MGSNNGAMQAVVTPRAVRVTFDGGEWREYDAIEVELGRRHSGNLPMPWFTFEVMQQIAEDWVRNGVDDVCLLVADETETADGYCEVSTCDGNAHADGDAADTFEPLETLSIGDTTYYAMHGYAWREVEIKG